MSSVVQSCCSIRVRNQLLKIVFDASAMTSESACRAGPAPLWPATSLNTKWKNHPLASEQRCDCLWEESGQIRALDLSQLSFERNDHASYVAYREIHDATNQKAWSKDTNTYKPIGFCCKSPTIHLAVLVTTYISGVDSVLKLNKPIPCSILNCLFMMHAVKICLTFTSYWFSVIACFYKSFISLFLFLVFLINRKYFVGILITLFLKIFFTLDEVISCSTFWFFVLLLPPLLCL